MPNISLTDTASQLAELQRRQRLAEALSAQGAAPIEVQSYKGIQSPISPFSALAKVLQTYMGARGEKKAAEEQKTARQTAREEAVNYIENLGKTPDISRFEAPVSAQEARQQAAVPALTPIASTAQPETIQTGGIVPTDVQGNMTPAATMQAPVPKVYSNAQPSAYAGPQATVMPGRETTPQERMASLLQAGMSGNPILEQMAPAMYGKIEGQIEAQAKADRLKAQIAAMTGLTDEQKSAYAQIVDVNPQAAGNFLKDVLTPKETKPAEYGQMRAAAVERVQQGQPPLPGDDILLYGARGAAPARVSASRAPGRALAQGLQQTTPKPASEPKITAFQEKELTKISKASNAIKQALTTLDAAPEGAFSFGRGLATLGGEMGESLASRKDTPEARNARYAVFNNVSNVIKERAGTAQSKSEKETLMKFLPNQFDSEPVIRSKLGEYLNYLIGQEEAVRNPNAPIKPVSAAPVAVGTYSDPAKEAAYQAWKKANKP